MKNSGNTILLIGDIAGLILSLFPHLFIPPFYFILINLLFLTITFINTLRKKNFRKLTIPETVLLEHTYHINAISISPDGRYLASCGGDNLSIIWNLAKKKVFLRIQEPSWVGNIAFSPDNQHLFTLVGKNGIFSTWETKKQTKLFSKVLEGGEYRGLAVSKDGHRVVVSNKNGSFYCFDPMDEKYYSMAVHISDTELRKVCFSNEKSFAIGNANGEVFLIDYSNSPNYTVKKIYGDVNHEVIRGIAFDSTERNLAITDSAGFLKIINISTQKVVSVKAHNGHAIAVVFSPNNKYIFTGGQDNVICVWEYLSNEIKKVFEIIGHDDDVTSLAIDTKNKLYSAGRDNSIKIWNLKGLY